MSNKELFINSYLERIAKKFNVDKDIAFEIFSIGTVLEKGFDEVYQNVVIKGNQDGGIDGVYFEESGSFYTVHIFQCKNKKALSQNQIEKFKNDFIDIFINGNKNINTNDINYKIEEYIDLTSKGYIINPNLYYIYNGENNDESKKANIELYKKFNNQDENFYIWDSAKIYNKIHSIVKSQNKREDINFVFKPVKSNVILRDNQALYSFSINNINAINFRIPAIELCKLVDNEKEINNTYDYLFSDNIRSFLGLRSKANKKMKATLDNPDESIFFPFLNNGITIICESLTLPSGPQYGEYNIPTSNPVVVNGLQTTRVLYEKFKEDETALENVFVNVRLYQTKDPNLIEKITDATNTQTPINFKDKISNKKFNQLAKQLFENNNILYITKRGEFFNVEKDFNETVQSETVLKFWYASFYEKPEIAKNSISKVLEEIYDATNEENPLKDLFSDDENSPIFLQLLNSYKLYRKVIKERKNNSEDDFIKYADEILSYGIYKELQNNLHDIDNLIDTAYKKAFKIVKKIVEDEFKNYKDQGKETSFSYNSYFKKPKCRIDYNTNTSILESNNIVNDLLNQ